MYGDEMYKNIKEELDTIEENVDKLNKELENSEQGDCGELGRLRDELEKLEYIKEASKEVSKLFETNVEGAVGRVPEEFVKRCSMCGKKLTLFDAFGYYDDFKEFYLCEGCAERVFLRLIDRSVNGSTKKVRKILRIIYGSKWKEMYKKYNKYK